MKDFNTFEIAMVIVLWQNKDIIKDRINRPSKHRPTNISPCHYYATCDAIWKGEVYAIRLLSTLSTSILIENAKCVSMCIVEYCLKQFQFLKNLGGLVKTKNRGCDTYPQTKLPKTYSRKCLSHLKKVVTVFQTRKRINQCTHDDWIQHWNIYQSKLSWMLHYYTTKIIHAM